MKNHAKHFLALCLLFVVTISTTWAQTPQAINYQAALRNADGSIMASTAVNLKFTIIHDDGTPENYYIETHTTTTTAQGLVNIKLGKGTAIAGTAFPIFANIPWSEGQLMLKVEVQLGAAAYVNMGTQQLVSVPFALHASNTNAISSIEVSTTIPTTNQVLKYNGTEWAPGTDNNTTTPTGAAGGSLTGTYPNPTIANNAVTTIRIADTAITTAKLANGAVTGTKLNAMGAYSGQVLKYNGTTWVPGNDDNTEGWGLSGNEVSSFDKIGTTNNQNLHFIRNNQLSGIISSDATALGYLALSNIGTSYASQNTAFGTYALRKVNYTGKRNSAFGYKALDSNIVGLGNSAFGYLALRVNLGSNNSAFGENALYSNSDGYANAAFGTNALNHNTTGTNNTGIGVNSLDANTNGTFNVAVGRNAMDNNVTGSYNTAVGYNAGVGSFYSNSTSIGNAAPTVNHNRIRLGNASTIGVGAQIGWTSYSDARIKSNVQANVPGLDFITKLRPVTYRFDIHTQNQITGSKDDSDFPEKYDIEKITQTGFIAQEVETVAQAIGYDFSGISLPSNDKDLYGLRYAEFVVPLVKAVQEQQVMIEELRTANKKLQERMDLLENK